jgi:cytochrome P450
MQQASFELASVDPDYTRNPYPIYTDLREHAPVQPVVLHGLTGWMVTRYDDVRRALSDPTLSHDRENANPAARSAAWLFADEAFGLQHHMLRSDPPAHSRIRRLAAPAFTPGHVAVVRDRARAIADELIDRFAPAGHVELISAYAFPLPLMLIMEVLGVPADDRAQLHQWSDILSSGSAATPAMITATLTSMRTYFADLARIKAGRRAAGDEDGESGLLDRLVEAHVAGDLSEDELLSSAFQLLQGGHVTTLGLIANGTLALVLEPDRIDALRADPARIDALVDELLRFDSPMEVATIRFTTQETTIGDVVIPGDGQPVILALGAANRDPARFPAPDTLDLDRDAGGHLSFGAGAHACLGANLARTEARVAFQALLDRLENLTLAVDPSELTWRPNPHLRRPEELPITFMAR